MKPLLTVLAFLIAGAKFPFIGRGPKLDRIPADTWPRVREPGRWIHDMTNVAVETVRADCEFWTKALVWLAMIEFVALVAALFF